MATPNQAPSAPKAKRARKDTRSIERKALESQLENFKGSDQEKTALRGKLKIMRFKEIVVPRVRRVLAQLESVGKLANRNAYTWDEEQAKKIAASLTNATNSVVQKFAGAKDSKPTFDL